MGKEPKDEVVVVESGLSHFHPHLLNVRLEVALVVDSQTCVESDVEVFDCELNMALLGDEAEIEAFICFEKPLILNREIKVELSDGTRQVKDNIHYINDKLVVLNVVPGEVPLKEGNWVQRVSVLLRQSKIIEHLRVRVPLLLQYFFDRMDGILVYSHHDTRRHATVPLLNSLGLVALSLEGNEHIRDEHAEQCFPEETSFKHHIYYNNHILTK